MSYHFFGNYGETAEEVLIEGKKQKNAETVVSAVLNPLSFAARSGAKVVTGSSPAVVSDDKYMLAMILKTLKNNNLAPHARFERTVRKIVLDIMKEHHLLPPHPHWISGLRK
jgi:hypothetical protein